MNYIYRNIMMTLVLALVPFMGISAKKKTVQQSDRQYWCSLAYKMTQPVLENMAKGELQKNMQTEFSPSFDNRNKKVLYMECFGRLIDEYRVNSACRKVEEWYVGDGWYADGPVFAFDYYSSYVFHPMYLETLQAMVDAKVNSRLDYQKYYDRELKRCQKYSIILERFISPEGTFPAFGRSIPYRMATMQPLALMAWYQTLPKDLSNGQVRAALTKVLHRMRI